MKTLLKTISALFALFVVLASCEQNTLAPDVVADDSKPLQQAQTQTENITFLSFQTNGGALAKPVVDSKLICAEKGGELLVTYNWDRRLEDATHKFDEEGIVHSGDEQGYNGKSKIYVSLKIPPGALCEDTELSLKLNAGTIAGEVDMVFSPHGTIFNKPAILNIHALHLDMQELESEDIDIYYDNQEEGFWETMESDLVLVNSKPGHIMVKNARLPHFSRYALAYGW